MNIRNLHIGDFVRVKQNVPVSGNPIAPAMELSAGSVYLDNKGYFAPEQLEAIPVSELKTMERLGFMVTNDLGGFCVQYGRSIRAVSDGDKVRVDVFKDGKWNRLPYTAPYLHHLQQLYFTYMGGEMELGFKNKKNAR